MLSEEYQQMKALYIKSKGCPVTLLSTPLDFFSLPVPNLTSLGFWFS